MWYDLDSYRGGKGSSIFVPMVGKGLMADMVPHTVFDGASWEAQQVLEPWGWRLLHVGADDAQEETEQVAMVQGEGEEGVSRSR